MRVLLLAGAAVIAGAAAAVPLPWSVSSPSALLPVADAVAIELGPELARAGADRGVSGEYLVVQHRDGATTLQLLTAAVSPSSLITTGGPPASHQRVHPLVAATMSGLGIVPRYADVAEIPVQVQVDPRIEGSAAGAALHAFDLGNDLDVARGRRIVGLGRMLDGGDLTCTAGVGQSVIAAARQQVDVVVVPAECAADAVAALPPDERLEVLEAANLTVAADALLAQ